MADEPDSLSDEMLIANVRGRLPEADAAQIAAEAAQRPDLAAELALVRGLAAAADAEADAPVPGELGWARLSRALDAEPARPARRVGPRLWPLAAAAAAAVLVWQVVAVPIITGPRGGEPRYAPVSEQAATGSTVSVAFVPTASKSAIRALLAEAGARISDGPSAIGLWQLSFADDFGEGCWTSPAPGRGYR